MSLHVTNEMPNEMPKKTITLSRGRSKPKILFDIVGVCSWNDSVGITSSLAISIQMNIQLK
jgi:hypothetical protein